MKQLLFCFFYLLFACGSIAQKQSPSNAKYKFKVLNLMPAFWQFFDDVKGQPNAVKYNKFVEKILLPNEKFFAEVVELTTKDTQQIVGSINYMDTVGPLMRVLSERFMSAFDSTVNMIANISPQIRNFANEIYIIPSFFYSNGQARYWNGKWILFFGLDTQATLGEYSHNLRITILHEIIHLMHDVSNKKMAAVLQPTFNPKNQKMLPVYLQLYNEGLAVYLSRLYDPSISLATALSSLEMVKTSNTYMPRLVKFVKERLTSSKRDDIRDIFWMSPTTGEFPQRAGYLLGYYVVRDIHKQLKQTNKLFQLSDPELLMRIKKALDHLAQARFDAENN